MPVYKISYKARDPIFSMSKFEPYPIKLKLSEKLF